MNRKAFIFTLAFAIGLAAILTSCQLRHGNAKVVLPLAKPRPILSKRVTAKERGEPRGGINSIPEDVKREMLRYSWREGCPVDLDDLAYLEVPFWGYDDLAHMGKIIVHKKAAVEVYAIFIELYEKKFPILTMELIDKYEGSDDKSMAANNTSGFNCRHVTGSSTKWSKHAFGMAIDINPLVNPYIKGDKIYPPEGKNYLDRGAKVKGMIVKGGPCYKSFASRGWKWGGHWRKSKDYQHFQKVYP